ncbi:hypothetical protein ACQEVZ_27780 [Dactylosporangium sp. CA-152071]|uniref:hypothetical protein n=1 Tax=Dactylosporangium sp. CA-152071 TaxID=3239933 RepID=UPI003D8C5C9E
MHPADVAEYVTESVEVLRDRLRQHPGLTADEPVLEDATRLYIPFAKTDRQLVAQAVLSTLVLPGGQPTAFVFQVPLLGAPPATRNLVLHMDLTDYDGQPPTAELLRVDRTPLPPGEWPKSLVERGIVRDHKNYARPFFCRRGLREYHSHPEHEDDPWDRHREELPLHALVIELLVALRDTWIGIR